MTDGFRGLANPTLFSGQVSECRGGGGWPSALVMQVTTRGEAMLFNVHLIRLPGFRG